MIARETISFYIERVITDISDEHLSDADEGLRTLIELVSNLPAEHPATGITDILVLADKALEDDLLELAEEHLHHALRIIESQLAHV